MSRRLRRAFTLIELLAVIGIIALLSALVIGLKPENPKGLSGATQRVQSMLTLARSQAMLGNIDDPADTEGSNKYATVRTRLLILNDPEDPDNHLRLMGVAFGAQVIAKGSTAAPKTEADLSGDSSSLRWFAATEPMKLPEGVYYAENSLTALRAILRSDTERNLTFSNTPTMKLDFPSRSGKKEGEGKSRTWYYYEFLADGSCNSRDTATASDTKGTSATGARLMFIEGDLPPGASQPLPKNGNKEIVGGMIITPRGMILPVTGLYEQKEQK